jgi:hypothetical protein
MNRNAKISQAAFHPELLEGDDDLLEVERHFGHFDLAQCKFVI